MYYVALGLSGTNVTFTPTGGTVDGQPLYANVDAGLFLCWSNVYSDWEITASPGDVNAWVSPTIAGTYTSRGSPPPCVMGAPTILRESYLISGSAGAHGSIDCYAYPVLSGSNVMATFTPDAGYGIASITVDSVSVPVTDTYTFTDIQANHTIAVTFEKVWTIAVSAGTGGSVSPVTGTVAEGTSPVFAITPSTGYAVASVAVDGVAVGTLTSYTFVNVTADHTLAVTFAAPSIVWAKEIEYLAEKNARFVSYNDSPVLFRQELVREWPAERDALISSSLAFIHQFASAQNVALTKRTWVTDPFATKQFSGLWRVVSNERVSYANTAQPGGPDRSGIRQTLRKGFAQTLLWDEVRIINNRQTPGNSSTVPTVDDSTSDSPEDYLLLEFANIDPDFARSIVATLGQSVDIVAALNTRFGLYNTHATYPAYAQGSWHKIAATIMESDQNDGSARIQVMLARPQFTLQGYASFMRFFSNYEIEMREYHLWNVPKALAQTIVDQWKDIHRSADVSYAKNDGTVDIVLREHMHPMTPLVLANAISGITCSSVETTSFYWGVYDPTQDVYDIGESVVAQSPGYTLTRSLDIDKEEGRFVITLNTRRVYTRNIDWALTQKSPLSDESIYQQFGVLTSDGIIPIDSPKQGQVYQRSIQVNPDCSKDVRVTSNVSQEYGVKFKNVQTAFQQSAEAMYHNSRSVITMPAGYTGLGIYRVDQTMNLDGTYTGNVGYQIGTPDTQIYQTQSTYMLSEYVTRSMNQTNVPTLDAGVVGVVYQREITKNEMGLFDIKSQIEHSEPRLFRIDWTDMHGGNFELLYMNWRKPETIAFGAGYRGEVMTNEMPDGSFHIRASGRPNTGATTVTTIPDNFYFYRTEVKALNLQEDGSGALAGKQVTAMKYIFEGQAVMVTYHSTQAAAHAEGHYGYNARITQVGQWWRCEKVEAQKLASDGNSKLLVRDQLGGFSTRGDGSPSILFPTYPQTST